jgi:hypothetical protein
VGTEARLNVERPTSNTEQGILPIDIMMEHSDFINSMFDVGCSMFKMRL